MPFATTLLAYALGCLNTGYYLVRVRTGADLRSQGSGTAGATNTGRVLGHAGFVIAMVGDVLKGGAAVGAAFWLAPDTVAAPLAAVAVVAGHIYPAQLAFRGGKGLATSFGAAVTLAPLVAGAALATALLWLALSRRPVEAGLIGVGSLPVATLALRGFGTVALAAFAIAGVVFVRHARVIGGLVAARRTDEA